MPRITPNWKKEKVIELYKSGVSQSVIEKELQMTRKTIRELIKNSDEHYKTRSEQWLIRYGNNLDETIFDELNEESLYWIGLLYADGHIRKDKEFSIELTLHSQDYNHLEKYKTFLHTNREIKKIKNQEAFRLRINSERIHKRLQELEFKHDKSYTAKPHESLKNNKDFWRGVIDGDGGVYKYERIEQVFLCGTLETIFDFIMFCSKNCEIKDKYPSKSDGKNHYQVHYYGQDAKKIVKILYKDSKTYLDRKYQKYLEIINPCNAAV